MLSAKVIPKVPQLRFYPQQIRHISLFERFKRGPFPPATNKPSNKKKDGFIHDFSLLPSMVQLRLPSPGVEQLPNQNVLRYLFEQGGVDTMDYEKNLNLYNKYPLTNSKRLAKRTKRPKSVKMLTSDFIEDSLKSEVRLFLQRGYYFST
ncbi:unnamed protein product [Ambrosiozyma monospora]|uniref:Unnamed protein product n=1 Tax=Ambrosiozyma monospora TaxID=43982 RepID=A0ACB5TXB3_AMBMO|nr:unnamed protein product [Ambrosiozyma monospora]